MRLLNIMDDKMTVTPPNRGSISLAGARYDAAAIVLRRGLSIDQSLLSAINRPLARSPALRTAVRRRLLP
jgi:hypothetical protein